MTNHHTKHKGDIGLTKIIADLTEKGYYVSLPINEHAAYDLIVDIDGGLKRVQVKFRGKRSGGKSVSFGCKTTHVGSNGKSVNKHYSKDDFELYGIYSSNLKLCYYIPNIGQNTISITEEPTNSYTKIYWYEDFLNPEITTLPEKRNPSSFDNFNPVQLQYNLKHYHLKVENRPNFETLQKEIDELGFVGTGKKYGVSDNAIRKWLKRYENNI